MQPIERRDSGQNELFRARLDQVVDLDHALAKLGRSIDWRFLEERFGAVCLHAGRPALLQPAFPTEHTRATGLRIKIGTLRASRPGRKIWARKVD